MDEQHPITPVPVQTAEQDIVRSATVLSEWHKALGNFMGLYERNGFGENLVAIMKSPARGAH